MIRKYQDADLGLIYNLDIDEDHTVTADDVDGTNCPEAETIPGRIQQAVQDAEGVEDVDIELVFDPPWTRERMSTAALLALGLTKSILMVTENKFLMS